VSKRILTELLLAAAALLACSGANAEVFRCVDGAGRILYTDRPCPSGSRTTDVFAASRTCENDDCLQHQERDAEEAQQRGRLEQEHLEALGAEQERRRRAEQDAQRLELELRAREADAQRLEAELRARELALAAPVAPVEAVTAPVYIVYPPAWWCTGPRCFRPPHPPAHRPEHPIAGNPGSNCVGPRCFPRPQPGHQHANGGRAPNDGRDAAPGGGASGGRAHNG
jgi:hypothetical protein